MMPFEDNIDDGKVNGMFPKDVIFLKKSFVNQKSC
jgi:hypothetical protein